MSGLEVGVVVVVERFVQVGLGLGLFEVVVGLVVARFGLALVGAEVELGLEVVADWD